MVQSTIKFRNVVIPIPKILEVWVKSTPIRKKVGDVGSVTVGYNYSVVFVLGEEIRSEAPMDNEAEAYEYLREIQQLIENYYNK